MIRRFTSLNDWFMTLAGWQRYGVAFVLGFLTAASMAPYYVLPFLVTGFSGLVWLMDNAVRHQRPGKVAFWTGCWFAFGYFCLSLYWMAFSFIVHAEGPGHLIMLSVLGFGGVFGLAAFISVFYGLTLLVAKRFWQAGWARVLVLAIAWSLAEYARGHLFTGLPWNLTGQAFAGLAVLSQPVAWIGTYGLGFIILIASALPAACVPADREAMPSKISPMPLAAAAGMVLVICIAGAIRLAGANVSMADNIRVQIVQPNILQRDKINYDLWVDNFWANLNLSGGVEAQAPEDGQLYVIWPENAAYSYFQRDPSALDVLQDRLPANAVLMAGGTRYDAVGPDLYDYFNSLLILSRSPLPGEETPAIDQMESETPWSVRRAYDKHHLAPFGEYVPLAGLLQATGVGNIVPIGQPFTPGAGPETIDLGLARMSPVICYETIFPGRLYPRGDRPDFLVTITNDAWYGDSNGPRQHFDISRLRAIESGLPMARSANTGISAMIDPYGRIVKKLPLYERGVINSQLPGAIPPTIYHYTSDFVYFILLAITALWVITSYNVGVRSQPSA
ncbi:apolipoprotein N-acyltransferase [Parvularcula flava]|uniref:Apolipoprotein N-acyltransferase n=1 Tax=Aquisalinus luteolus TaxID=1566827 RepID=A0A8J3ERL5_9PROT|nr:apolipoprotein N-acyltransferase [Aquisalinus luteolus]NHK28266.1 apolipoprotein N-acyltransferase [Aquisalinus luteolus]GGH97964.1 apolipoprotein N-acyltransferase [Aquisalinus luteolus]